MDPEFERRITQYVAINVEICSLTYGNSPCQAVTGVTGAVFDPARTDGNITISGSSTSSIATKGAAAGWSNAFADLGFTTGLRVFQFVCNSVVTASRFGVGNASASLTTGLGDDNNSIAIRASDADVYLNNVDIANTGTSVTAGETVEVAVDADARLAWFRQALVISSAVWNGDPTANPYTGTGGLDISVITGELFACIGLQGNTAQST